MPISSRLPTAPPPCIEPHADPLRAVVEHYHDALRRTPRAMEYLARLGLAHTGIIEHFQLGFSDRTLHRRIAGSGAMEHGTREDLARLGVWRANGHEHLRGCIVAPVLDSGGVARQCHGRPFSGRRAVGATSLTLGGAPPALWNAHAIKPAGDVIVCDDVLAGLTLWSFGERQVVACARADGRTGIAMLAELLRQRRSVHVSIAFAADAWGESAAQQLHVALAADGIPLRRVPLPRGYDISAYARLHEPAAQRVRAIVHGLPLPRASQTKVPTAHESRPLRRKVASTPATAALLLLDITAHLRALEEACYAATTVAARRAHLGMLASALISQGVSHSASVTPAALDCARSAIAHRAGISSQGNIITAIRMFFGWAVRTQRLAANPATDLERPRMPQRLPRAVLSIGEVERVLSQAPGTTLLGLRDRAIMEVLYSTGIRRMELIALDVPDFDADRGVLLVREGKGRKDRYVPIGERAVRWALRYLDESRPRLARPGDVGAFFLSSRGNRMRPSRLTAHLHDLLMASGIGKSGSCHIFRHTMATLMHDGGADIRDLQEMLGHSLLSTTQLYARVSLARLKAVHARTHPARLVQ